MLASLTRVAVGGVGATALVVAMLAVGCDATPLTPDAGQGGSDGGLAQPQVEAGQPGLDAPADFAPEVGVPLDAAADLAPEAAPPFGSDAATDAPIGGRATTCLPRAVAAGQPIRLREARNIASPLADPTGVALDAGKLWIIAGGHNSTSNTLVRFNPKTLAIDRQFSFSNLIEQPGTGVYGIAFDGTSVWISVSGNTNKLVVVDPTTGQITRSMSSPTDLGPSDLDFDGTDLWLASGTGKVFRIDRVTGGILKRLSTVPDSFGRDWGVAFTPGQLWVGDLFGGIEVHDPATGAWLARATHDDGSAFTQEEMGPSTFDGCQLVIANKGITWFDLTLDP